MSEENVTNKVLIADDDPLVRDSMSRVLGLEGYECDTAGDGRECLKKLTQKTYDILILDLVMPELDGEQVMNAIRGRFCGTDIVIVSAQDDEDIIKSMLDLGATAYLVKPFGPKAYIDVLAEITDNRLRKCTQAGIPQPQIK